jgi:hypothetical protein
VELEGHARLVLDTWRRLLQPAPRPTRRPRVTR